METLDVNAQYEKFIQEAKKLEKFVKSLQNLETKSTKSHLFECPECDFITFVGKSFIMHFQVHLSVQRYYCIDCDFDCDSKKGFLQHQNLHSRSEKIDGATNLDKCNDTEQMFDCSFCKYRTNRKWNLSQHLLLHEEENDMYACHICPYKTKFRRRLKLHLQDHNEGKRFCCPICDYKTSRKGSLHQHMQIHSREKRFQCPSCSYKTNRKWSLRKHFKTHSEENKLSDINFEIDSDCSKEEHRKVHRRVDDDTTHLAVRNVKSNTYEKISLSKNVDDVIFDDNVELKELDLTWITSDVQL